MRPRVATSAEPGVRADVNVRLIEVSSSVLMLGGRVKPLAGHIGRSSLLLEVLLDHLRGIVDADDVEALDADVLELVGCVRRHHDGVAGTRLELVAVSSEPRRPAADDPRLRVRMTVQVGTLARLVLHEEE
jgi:hypothetical protein